MAVNRLKERFGLPTSRVSRLVELQRSSFYYKPKTVDDESDIVRRMKELVTRHKSWGHPMIHDVLRREGLIRNHKRTWRIYKEQGLSLKIRKRKKRASITRIPLPCATHPNEKWSMDFMQGILASGRRFRMLAVIDNFTKECPMIEVDTSINGLRVERVLEWLTLTRRYPTSITVDNGPEFVGMVLDRWAYEKKVLLDFIRPGKPVENAFIESFNGRLRHECLNQHYFTSLEEARRIIEDWRTHYNAFRPHSSLGGLTPEAFAKKWQDENNSQNTQELYLEPVQLEG